MYHNLLYYLSAGIPVIGLSSYIAGLFAYETEIEKYRNSHEHFADFMKFEYWKGEENNSLKFQDSQLEKILLDRQLDNFSPFLGD